MSEQATYTEHVYQEYSCGSFVDPLHQREEIVRCRDCKHATINIYGECKYCELLWLPDVDGYGADPQVRFPGDHFCAWGERREQ